MFLFLFGIAQSAQAGWAFDLSGSATMGNFSSDTLSDNSIYMYEFAVGYADKGIGVAAGFVYTALNGNVYSSTGTNTYGSSLVGAKFFFSPPKWRWMHFGLSYYPSAILTDQTATTTTNHAGTAIEYEAGFNIALGGAWMTSLKLCYFSLNMTSNTTGSVTNTTPYNRNLVFPTATIRYGF